jgi:hypothetical protein
MVPETPLGDHVGRGRIPAMPQDHLIATQLKRVRIGEHSVVRARWGAEWRCVDFDLGRRGRVWVWRVAPCGAVGQGECVRGDFE